MQYQKSLKQNWKSYLGITALVFVFACSSSVNIQKLSDAEIAKLQSQNGTVVLNFWATWCEPCVEEIPIFIRLQEKNSDLVVVGISLDEANQDALVREFAKKHGMNYRVVLRQGENFETMVNSIDPDWMGGLPATFVFKNGKRTYSKTGLISEQELLDAVK